MARTLPGYRLPSGYALHVGTGEDSELNNRFWCTYVAPDGSGDPETLDADGWDTAREAQVEAWTHRAAELQAERDALRALVLQARGAWVRDISREPTHVDQSDAAAWVERSKVYLP